jgi:hypothetical protein
MTFHREKFMRVRVLIAVALVTMACAGSDTPANNRDTMTQRQRDSVLAQSRLPGAQGVGRALSASDSVRARNAQLDSIQP